MHHIKTAGLPPDLSDAIPRQTVFGRLQRGSLREIPAADGVRTADAARESARNSATPHLRGSTDWNPRVRWVRYAPGPVATPSLVNLEAQSRSMKATTMQKQRGFRKKVSVNCSFCFPVRTPEGKGPLLKYEGIMADRRIGGTDRESYIELKNSILVGKENEILALEGVKRLFDAWIDDMALAEQRSTQEMTAAKAAAAQRRVGATQRVRQEQSQVRGLSSFQKKSSVFLLRCRMNPMGMAAMGMAMMSAAKGMKDEDSEEESADEKEESKGAVPGPGPVPEATSQDVTKELLNIDEGAFLRVNYMHPQLGKVTYEGALHEKFIGTCASQPATPSDNGHPPGPDEVLGCRTSSCLVAEDVAMDRERKRIEQQKVLAWKSLWHMARRCSAPCDEMHLPRLLHQGETGRTGSKSLVPLSARSISKSSVDSSTSSPLGGGSWQLGGASRNLRRVSLQRGLVHETPPSKSDELPSFEELSRDLQGWNGRWKQKKASVLMEERLRVDEMEILQKRYEMEERRRKDEVMLGLGRMSLWQFQDD
ncbi:unnamed protein product [Cladocopium goreaui]|uniref:Uncharacterized protein n=1 Tax=Cladocopium goreaui TaxID=2562237 RepID=A0A9P1GJV7_9DINO|nr:unnamed protein product [Cladocopium goreaui]